MSEVPRVNKGGRPRKPRLAESPEALALKAKIREAEDDALKAGERFRKAPTMAHKTLALAAELRAAMLQRAWCVLLGDHTHGLRWAELVAKLSREHAAAAEADAIDKATELAQRSSRERSVARKVGKR